MNFKEAFESLELKFTSGNSIPIERNTILEKEWKAIKEELKKRKEAINGFKASSIALTFFLSLYFFLYFFIVIS